MEIKSSKKKSTDDFSFERIFILFGKKMKDIYFIWLHWFLVVAHGIFDLHCGMQDLQLQPVESSFLTMD